MTMKDNKAVLRRQLRRLFAREPEGYSFAELRKKIPKTLRGVLGQVMTILEREGVVAKKGSRYRAIKRF